MQKLRDEFDLHITDDAKWKAAMEVRIQNLEDIPANNRCDVKLQQITDETAGVVEVYNATKSFIWFSKGIQNVAFVLFKWGVISLGFASCVSYLVDAVNNKKV